MTNKLLVALDGSDGLWGKMAPLERGDDDYTYVAVWQPNDGGAGLIYGRARGLPYEQAGRLGSLLGSIQVEFVGTQNLELAFDSFCDRYEREFGNRF